MKKNRLVFAGAGNWQIPLFQGCMDDWTDQVQRTLCLLSDSEVWIKLTSPLELEPQSPWLPYVPWELPHRCVDRSVDPAWQVRDLLYKHHVVHGEDEHKKKYYDLSLTLTNVATAQSVSCDISMDELQAPNLKGITPFVQCADSPGSIGSTAVSLDATYGVLAVKQDWSCTDGIEGIESQVPSPFSG